MSKKFDHKQFLVNGFLPGYLKRGHWGLSETEKLNKISIKTEKKKFTQNRKTAENDDPNCEFIIIFKPFDTAAKYRFYIWRIYMYVK